MVIGQEYSHFSQLNHPLSTGCRVRDFVSVVSYPS
jgi:hypothetical protein